MKAIRWFAAALLLLSSEVQAQSKTEAESVLVRNREFIFEAAEQFGVSPRVMASVIFTEHRLNVNWVDRKLDVVLAKEGYNSSIGIGQVKVETAQWIEAQLHDSTSLYHLGPEKAHLIPLSSSREEIIQRLADPKQNLYYVAAYLAMFQRRWQEAGIDLSDRPGILATLYSLGAFNGQQERKPHGAPKENFFGRLSKAYYDSDNLLEVFPRE